MDKTKKLILGKKVLFIILLLLWMGLIFYFSHQPSEVSSETSGGAIEFILKITNITDGMSEQEKIELIDSMQHIVRKLAHFTIYLIGGVIIYGLVFQYEKNSKKIIFYSLLIGILYAISDEIHQYFIPGRSNEIKDVLIDSLGLLIGIIFVNIVIFLTKTKMKRDEIMVKRKKYIIIKSILDKLLALIALIILSPIMLIIALLIKIDSRGPVFFKQKRVKKNKEYFNILKYRTMKIDTPKDTPTHLLKDPDMYITRVGKVLRKTSLDELPQIINILKGEMSIVGPRPALWNQDDLIAERDKYGANDIKPGLTGWAQVNGRDELEIPVKAKFDGEYVEKMSFFFDIKVLFKTVAKVIKHDGVVEGEKKE